MWFPRKKGSGPGSNFMDFRIPSLVYLAVATSFIAHEPTINGVLSDGLHFPAIAHGYAALAGRIDVAPHNSVCTKSARRHWPTKTNRLKSTLTTSLPIKDKDKVTIITASLISVGVGAALALGSYIQGGASAAEEYPENEEDDIEDEDSDSGQAGGTPPPEDIPNDPSGTSNDAASPSKLSGDDACDVGGSPPPPPPPPPGTSVDDDNPWSIPHITVPILFILLPYWIASALRNLVRKVSFRRVHTPKKPSEPPAPEMTTPDTATNSFSGPSSLILSAESFTNATCPAVFELGPTWDSLDDWVGDESTHIATTTTALAIAVSSTPDFPTVEVWYSSGHRKIYRHLYQPIMPVSSNILPLRETTTCSVAEEPSFFITDSTKMFIAKNSFLLCFIPAALIGFYLMYTFDLDGNFASDDSQLESLANTTITYQIFQDSDGNFYLERVKIRRIVDPTPTLQVDKVFFFYILEIHHWPVLGFNYILPPRLYYYPSEMFASVEDVKEPVGLIEYVKEAFAGDSEPCPTDVDRRPAPVVAGTFLIESSVDMPRFERPVHLVAPTCLTESPVDMSGAFIVEVDGTKPVEVHPDKENEPLDSVDDVPLVGLDPLAPEAAPIPVFEPTHRRRRRQRRRHKNAAAGSSSQG